MSDATRHTILITFILMILMIEVSPASVYASEKPATLPLLIEEALSNNPELKSYDAMVRSFKERPSQAGALEDPRLRLAIANLPVDSFSFDQEAMTQKQIQVMQKIPFPGTLGLKENIATKDLAIAKTEFDRKRIELIRQVKVMYNDLVFLDRALNITTDNRKMLAEFIQTAETGYAAGQGSQQAILRARTELSKIIKKIISFEQKRETTVAYINILLNRPVQEDIHVAGDINTTELTFTYDELRIIADETSPALRGLRQKVEQSRLAIDLAEKEYNPDMDFGVSYGQRDDSAAADRPDFFSAYVTLNIPLWSKDKESRKVNEKKAEQRRSAEQYTSARNRIHFRLKELQSQIHMNEQEIELFRSGLRSNISVRSLHVKTELLN
jgi:outer membrane protein TolC